MSHGVGSLAGRAVATLLAVTQRTLSVYDKRIDINNSFWTNDDSMTAISAIMHTALQSGSLSLQKIRL